jgi:hypothetical protein
VDALQAEHDENECRKDFTPSERVAIARAIAERIGDRQGRRTDLPLVGADKAKAALGCRACEHPQEIDSAWHCPIFNKALPFFDGDEPPGRDCPECSWDGSEPDDDELLADLPEVTPGQQTRDHAAEAAGFSSTTTFRQAAKVVDEGAPEVVEAMDDGTLAVSAAAEVAALPREDQPAVVAEVKLGRPPRQAIKAALQAREQAAASPSGLAAAARAATPRSYPHSERLWRWLETVCDQALIINDMGGIKALLAEPDKWDRVAVFNFVLPMLEALKERISEFHREVSHAFAQE